MKINTDELINWIDKQAKEISFGEIDLKFIFHAGQLRRIEKSVTEKLQETGGGNG